MHYWRVLYHIISFKLSRLCEWIGVGIESPPGALSRLTTPTGPLSTSLLFAASFKLDNVLLNQGQLFLAAFNSDAVAWSWWVRSWKFDYYYLVKIVMVIIVVVKWKQRFVKIITWFRHSASTWANFVCANSSSNSRTLSWILFNDGSALFGFSKGCEMSVMTLEESDNPRRHLSQVATFACQKNKSNTKINIE